MGASREELFESFRSAIENRECAGELGAVVEQLITGAAAVLKADGALLVLIDESETPALAASCFAHQPLDATVNALVAAAGQVIREGRARIGPDDPTPPAARDVGAVLAVPFPPGERAFGALTLFRGSAQPWDSEDVLAAHAYARLVRLLLKHAASVNRPDAGGDWCAPLVPQQIPVRKAAFADRTWSSSAS